MNPPLRSKSVVGLFAAVTIFVVLAVLPRCSRADVPEYTTTKPGAALVIMSCTAQFNIINPSSARLAQGETIIYATESFALECDEFTLLFSPGVIAHVTLNNAGLIVRNLKDDSGHLRVLRKEVCFPVETGQELAIARDFDHLSTLVLSDGVMRRNPAVYEISTRYSMLHSDVWLCSLLRSSPTLKQIFRSTGDDEKLLIGKILKCAAGLSIVTRGHGSYAALSE